MGKVFFPVPKLKRNVIYVIYVIITIRSIFSLRRELIILNHRKRELPNLSVGMFLPVKSITKVSVTS